MPNIPGHRSQNSLSANRRPPRIKCGAGFSPEPEYALAAAAGRALLLAAERRVDAPQLGHGFARLVDTPLEHRDLIDALLSRQTQRLARGAAGARVDHLGDLRQREA